MTFNWKFSKNRGPNIRPGDRASEWPNTGTLKSTGVLVLENAPQEDFGQLTLNGFILTKPFDRFHFGLGFRLGFVEDSRSRANFFIGFCFPLAVTFLQTRNWKVDAMTSLDGDLAYRPDDEGDVADAFILGLVPRLQVQHMMSRKMDIVFGFGYRLFGQNTSWTVPTDDYESRPAKWNSGSPSIDTRGWTANLGFRFFKF